ncbi:MAG: tetratricopeptide repeat protein, partial [Ignavibacteriaceae bacterium]|nr:tetratricopeptide repeat protein [Ignavibacteriaceae bacterium]
MTDNINKSISEILPDFFNKNQVDEFLHIFRSSLRSKSDTEVFQQVNLPDFKVETGLSYRSQIDLLVTFAENKLEREKFLSLLLYLGQASITNGEFSAAIDVNEKIINLTRNDRDMTNLAANAHLLIGEIYSRQASWQNCLESINTAIRLFSSINDIKGVAKCENLLGTVYGDLGNIQKAVENFESALEKSNDELNYTQKGKIEINLGI